MLFSARLFSYNKTAGLTGSGCDHPIKFARWQHPAMAREARFAALNTICIISIS